MDWRRNAKLQLSAHSQWSYEASQCIDVKKESLLSVGYLAPQPARAGLSVS
jgi:hypothetical protein